MRKERLLRRTDAIKTDPACAPHVLRALPHPLARGSVSQSGRVARGGRSALEGRPSRIGGDASSARSSRSQGSSVRSRRDAQRGSQARTSARPSRRELELDPAQESRDAARQRLQARAAATQQERSSLSEGAQRSSARPVRAETLMRTARRTAVAK